MKLEDLQLVYADHRPDPTYRRLDRQICALDSEVWPCTKIMLAYICAHVSTQSTGSAPTA